MRTVFNLRSFNIDFLDLFIAFWDLSRFFFSCFRLSDLSSLGILNHEIQGLQRLERVFPTCMRNWRCALLQRWRRLSDLDLGFASLENLFPQRLILVNLQFRVMHNVDILNWNRWDMPHRSIHEWAGRPEDHGSLWIWCLLVKAINVISISLIKRRHIGRSLKAGLKSVAVVGTDAMIPRWIEVRSMDKLCFTRRIVNLNHLMNLSSLSLVWSNGRCVRIHLVRILLEDVETWRSHYCQAGLIHKKIVLIPLQVGTLKLVLDQLPLSDLVAFPRLVIWLALDLKEMNPAILLLVLQLSGKQLLLDLGNLNKLCLIDVHLIGIKGSLLVHFQLLLLQFKELPIFIFFLLLGSIPNFYFEFLTIIRRWGRWLWRHRILFGTAKVNFLAGRLDHEFLRFHVWCFAIGCHNIFNVWSRLRCRWNCLIWTLISCGLFWHNKNDSKIKYNL